MAMYILFGVKSADIEEARGWLENLVDLPVQARQSDFHEKYYKFGGGAGENMELKSWLIRDQEDEYPMEPDFPDWNLFLYVNRTSNKSRNLRAIEEDKLHFERLRTDA